MAHQALFFSLLLLGTVRTIWSGQTNLLIFSLVALATLAIQDQRWWRAAFLLAIPVHIKVWPLAAAVLLIAYWPRKLALRFPAAVLAVAAVPLLTRPWGWVWRQYVGWYDLLVGPAQIRHTYRDAWTLWEVLHEPVHAKVYMLLQLLSGAAVLGLCLWQVRRGLSVQRRLLFVLVSWAVWQMTFGPATERTTFGLIAPLSSWGLATAFQQRRGRLLMAVAFVLMTAANFGVIERALMDQFPLVAGRPSRGRHALLRLVPGLESADGRGNPYAHRPPRRLEHQRGWASVARRPTMSWPTPVPAGCCGRRLPEIRHPKIELRNRESSGPVLASSLVPRHWATDRGTRGIPAGSDSDAWDRRPARRRRRATSGAAWHRQ